MANSDIFLLYGQDDDDILYDFQEIGFRNLPEQQLDRNEQNMEELEGWDDCEENQAPKVSNLPGQCSLPIASKWRNVLIIGCKYPGIH